VTRLRVFDTNGEEQQQQICVRLRHGIAGVGTALYYYSFLHFFGVRLLQHVLLTDGERVMSGMLQPFGRHSIERIRVLPFYVQFATTYISASIVSDACSISTAFIRARD